MFFPDLPPPEFGGQIQWVTALESCLDRDGMGVFNVQRSHVLGSKLPLFSYNRSRPQRCFISLKPQIEIFATRTLLLH